MSGPDHTGRVAELAAAERWAREALNGPVPSHLVTLLTEYDRRGAASADRDAERSWLRSVEAAARAVFEIAAPDEPVPGGAWEWLRDALAAGPAQAEVERTWSLPPEPPDVGAVWGADPDTGESVRFEWGADGTWHGPRGTRYRWPVLLFQSGPLTVVEPAPPEERRP